MTDVKRIACMWKRNKHNCVTDEQEGLMESLNTTTYVGVTKSKRMREREQNTKLKLKNNSLYILRA